VKATTGRIWEAASTEASRPVLMHVMFDAKKGTLTATDSYVIARVPCEVEEGDESGLIPAAALKTAAGKSLHIADGKATLKLADGERSWPLLTGATFPDADKIISGYPPVDAPFGLNTRLLRELGNALGAVDHLPIALHPVHPLKGILVNGPAPGGATVGVIMPVRLDGHHEAPPLRAPDLSNDAAVLSGVQAAVAALDKRRGKKKAAQAFRDAVLAAMETAA
jgi:hypothetical protein